MGKIDFDALRKEVEAEFPDKPKKPYFKWSREQTEQLVSLIDEQKTVPEIAAALKGVDMEQLLEEIIRQALKKMVR